MKFGTRCAHASVQTDGTAGSRRREQVGEMGAAAPAQPAIARIQIVSG